MNLISSLHFILVFCHVDPAGVHQPEVVFQQRAMYNNPASGLQQYPQPLQASYYQPQDSRTDYLPQSQASGAYQPPQAYTQEEKKSTPN